MHKAVGHLDDVIIFYTDPIKLTHTVDRIILLSFSKIKRIYLKIVRGLIGCDLQWGLSFSGQYLCFSMICKNLVDLFRSNMLFPNDPCRDVPLLQDPGRKSNILL